MSPYGYSLGDINNDANLVPMTILAIDLIKDGLSLRFAWTVLRVRPSLLGPTALLSGSLTPTTLTGCRTFAGKQTANASIDTTAAEEIAMLPT